MGKRLSRHSPDNPRKNSTRPFMICGLVVIRNLSIFIMVNLIIIFNLGHISFFFQNARFAPQNCVFNNQKICFMFLSGSFNSLTVRVEKGMSI